MKSQPITLEGIAYPSIKAAAEAYGIKAAAANNRLKRGWTVGQAFGLEVREPARGKPVTINGAAYSSIKAAAEAYGIKPALICTRLRMSWTVEQAFGLEARPRRSASLQKVTVNGVDYRSMQAACKACHISRADVIFYLNRGIAVEQAFEIVSQKQCCKKASRKPTA